MFLTRASVHRPIATLMAVLAVCLGGIVGIFNLPVDMMPSSESRQVTVFVGVRGGMPSEDIEQLITEPMEEALATLPGLKEILSVSRKDRSSVTLFFDDKTNVKRATLDVSERLARIKGKLPKEIEKPIVARYNENDHPILILSATSTSKTPEFLRSMIERDLKPDLSRVAGVANVEVSGGRQRKILVEFEKSKLDMFTLPILEVIRQLGANNVSTASGKYDSGRDSWAVQFVGDFKTLEEMKELGVLVTKEGSRVRLKDIANVRDYYMEAESYARVNSKPAVSIYVQKENGANTIRTARAAVDLIRDYQHSIPKDIGISVSTDQSVAINQAIKDVRGALTEGALLTALVLWFFLRRFKQVGVILLSIPVAVLATFLVMLLHGAVMSRLGNDVTISINVMSLLGIALGIGRMVDDSIVVFENIWHRYQEAHRQGRAAAVDKIELAIDATKEMAVAVASSTLVLVVIFAPIVLFSEDIRRQFADVAFTVIVSLMASLFVAVTVVPLLASRMMSVSDEGAGMMMWERRMLEFFRAKMERWRNGEKALASAGGIGIGPRNLIDEKLHEPMPMQSSNANAGVDAPAFPVSPEEPQEIKEPTPPAVEAPAKKSNGFIGWIFSPVGALVGLCTRLYYQTSWSAVVRRGTGWAVRNRGLVMGGVVLSLFLSVFLYARVLPKEFIGESEKNEFIIFVELPSGSKLDVSDKVVAKVENEINSLPEVKNVVKTVAARVEGWSSKLYVTLSPAAERTRTIQDVIDALRPRLKLIGAEYEAFIYFSEAQSSKELIIDCFGKDYLTLRDVAVDVAKNIQQVPGLRDVKLRYKPGRPEIKLEIDHARAALFGLNSRDIADTLHAQVRGLRATYFNAGSEQVETVARLSEEDRRTVEHLSNLTLVSQTKKRHLVPVLQVLELQNGFTPSEVWRKNKERVIQVSANRERVALSTVAKNVKAALKNMKVPIGYHYALGGDYEKLVKSEKEFMYAFIVMALLVYMVLACFFESYSQPFLMLLTIPLATAGSMPVLWLTKTSVNMGVYIGLLMLGGTVTSNAVILIDRLNAVRKTRPLLRAVLKVGIERSRPIFMTSLSTIAAMLPLTFGTGESADLWAPLALTVVSGIAVSSVLTLFVIPAAYVMQVSFQRNWRRLVRGEVSLDNLIHEMLSARAKMKEGGRAVGT